MYSSVFVVSMCCMWLYIKGADGTSTSCYWSVWKTNDIGLVQLLTHQRLEHTFNRWDYSHLPHASDRPVTGQWQASDRPVTGQRQASDRPVTGQWQASASHCCINCDYSTNPCKHASTVTIVPTPAGLHQLWLQYHSLQACIRSKGQLPTCLKTTQNIPCHLKPELPSGSKHWLSKVCKQQLEVHSDSKGHILGLCMQAYLCWTLHPVKTDWYLKWCLFFCLFHLMPCLWLGH